jgi:trimeric autotransporter adhesin
MPRAEGSWTNLTEGVGAAVRAIVASGSDVYVGGGFLQAGGIDAARVARWDGSSWHALGDGPGIWPMAMAVDSDGHIYAGGFPATGANAIMRWDGEEWVSLGALSHSKGLSPFVTGLYIDELDRLFIGGGFDTIAGIYTGRVAMWDGKKWSGLGTGVVDFAYAFVSDGKGGVFVGGQFSAAEGSSGNGLVHWDGEVWTEVGGGTNNVVHALAINEDGLYAAGSFTQVGSTPARRIARWDGESWHTLGHPGSDGANNLIWDIDIRNGYLYAGGGFSEAGGNAALSIARWDGEVWSSVGEGDENGVNNQVYTVMAATEGVYVGGEFTVAGSVEASRIALWQPGAVGTEHNPRLASFVLYSPYPNPFSSSATIAISLAQAQAVRLEVFDVLGRRVAVLHDGLLAEGTGHRFTLDAAGLAAGRYLVRASSERFLKIRGVSVVR